MCVCVCFQEEQERTNALQNQVEILKRQLARDSDALDRERNAAALEREKSETERNKLKEVTTVSCAFALLSFREETVRSIDIRRATHVFMHICA